MEDSKIELARKYCIHYHEGQFRKGTNQPYHVHPIAVADLLYDYGYKDPITQCISLLHDTVEDTPATMDEIKEVFGYEIANGVYILSKNKGKISSGEKLSKEDYKVRLSFARAKIQRVKIGDITDNTRDLESLSLEGIERKIKDAEEFYIPMGRKICPLMIKELESNIFNYKRKLNLLL